MPAIKKKWIKASEESEDASSTAADTEASVVAADNEESKISNKRAHSDETTVVRGHNPDDVILEKRKRFTPPGELKLAEWLESNFESKPEVSISLVKLYKQFTDLCQTDGAELVDITKFNSEFKKKFGKTFGLKPDSIYKSILKEKKIGEKKVSSGTKMKDVIVEAINHFGNPWSGVRFNRIKTFIGSKYPALQIDAKPKTLNKSLQWGVMCRYLELVKGIGMCGFYRLPGAVEAKPKPKTEKDTAESEEKTEENGDKSDEKGDKTEEKTDETTTTETAEEESKPKSPKKPVFWSYSSISWTDPAKMEDVFPLAITYQSTGKVAAIMRIRRYIEDNYSESYTDKRIRSAIDHGVDKQYWEYISGQGLAGKLHLLMDDFDPESDQIEDQICAAIIACHEPKSCSGSQIKKYLVKYHTDYKIDERPQNFKKALQRAVDKNMLVQVSGLGANGSFQLVVPFVPTPAILAGNDDSDAESDEEEKPVYVSKGTKSRGVPKSKTIERATTSKPVKKKKPVYKKYSSDEEEENVKPKKGGKKTVSKSKPSPKKNQSSRKKPKITKKIYSSDEDEADNEEETVEYTPKKTKSRGGITTFSNFKPSSKVTQSNTKAKTSNSKKLSASKRKASTESEDEEEERVEYTPRKSQSRSEGSSSSRKSLPKSGGSKKKAVFESEDEEAETVEYTPRKSQSRSGGSASGKNKSGRKGKK